MDANTNAEQPTSSSSASSLSHINSFPSSPSSPKEPSVHSSSSPASSSSAPFSTSAASPPPETHNLTPMEDTRSSLTSGQLSPTSSIQLNFPTEDSIPTSLPRNDENSFSNGDGHTHVETLINGYQSSAMDLNSPLDRPLKVLPNNSSSAAEGDAIILNNINEAPNEDNGNKLKSEASSVCLHSNGESQGEKIAYEDTKIPPKDSPSISSINHANQLECQHDIIPLSKSNEISGIGSASECINTPRIQKLDIAESPLPNSYSDSCVTDVFIERKASAAQESSHDTYQQSMYTSSGFERSKTLPNESHQSVDDFSSPVRHGLLRSCTDLTKQRQDLGNHVVGTEARAKLSHRKKKKLMKRIATIQKDGTVEFTVSDSAQFASDLFTDNISQIDKKISQTIKDAEEKEVPPLQIAMLIVGTRGDVQPFVAIGKSLKEQGHRVRLATHANFHDFVRKAGLEFYPLGGDPKVLAGYMVKNKGFLPSGPSEIRTQRKQLRSIINSLLPACTEPFENEDSFMAQAIIANPPAYGHVHVAEFLGVPLHIFFTMPWTPTSEFPHPLARVKQLAAYKASYFVVDSLISLGIRGIINEFRKKKLKLHRITYLSGSQESISDLPTGYIWSPHLVPKPKDWGSLVDVVGFCYLDLAKDYKAPEALVSWLQAGPSPIYIGFGSLPVEDPQGMTEIILEALKRTNQRGIIDRGWGGIGNLQSPPESVYLLENCPHDWLFPQCAAVVHHGGAGTTAAGLKAACPTTIVPFFGDQPFWGERVCEKGIGPPPIPILHFSLEKLVDAINFMLQKEVKKKAKDLAEAIKEEDGVAGAVKAFLKHLPKDMPKPLRLPTPSKPFYSFLSGFWCGTQSITN